MFKGSVIKTKMNVLFYSTILSYLAVIALCFPPYSNDVYLQMALERQRNPAYGYPYGEYGNYENNYLDGQAEDDTPFSWIDMEVDAFWPSEDLVIGQVGGVAVDAEDNPVIFHRADHPWSHDLFDDENNFIAKEAGPIAIPTVLTVSSDRGKIINAWGANKFYMPHGLTIDDDGNVWLTDVAMHQVFKFTPGEDEPSLILGKEFEPAADESDEERFCKPTDVAVASDGTIFVSDGYCNNRVMRFSADGKFEAQFGEDELNLPHSLALAQDLDLICVADRENKRIVCYNAGLNDINEFGRLEREYTDPNNAQIYAVEYSPKTGLLFAVNGPTYKTPGTGFTIDLQETKYLADIVDVWSPFNNGFTAPHDLVVCHCGNHVYVGEITLQGNNIWKFENIAADISPFETKINDLDALQQYVRQTMDQKYGIIDADAMQEVRESEEESKEAIEGNDVGIEALENALETMRNDEEESEGQEQSDESDEGILSNESNEDNAASVEQSPEAGVEEQETSAEDKSGERIIDSGVEEAAM